MEEKILTIDKINFVGKWAEFWFKEEHPSMDGVNSYHLSSKGYMLWDAAIKAEIEGDVYNYGFTGRKIKWVKQGSNWEIDSFVKAE